MMRSDTDADISPSGETDHPRVVFARAARCLADHPLATCFDLIEQNLMSAGAFLAPERVLSFPVDISSTDLVSEFREHPLGPHSETLTWLLWLLRAQTPSGRYVLVQEGTARWQVLRLAGGRLSRPQPVSGAAFPTLEDAEWAVFALRWRDHGGSALGARSASA